jgi:MerR family transcriptional regulator, copper efflux regulator
LGEISVKIQELAERTGLTPYAIRFYEKQGLLDGRHVRREGNNYRNYSDEAIERLKFVKKLQSIGCSIAELKEILHDRDTNRRANNQVIEWIRSKIDEVERRKEECDQILATLNGMLEHRLRLND